MNIYSVVLVGVGGFFGSAARYVLLRLVDERTGKIIPYGTLTVNIIGCLIIGILYGLITRRMGSSENMRLLIGVGFCGGFTTFSAFAFENLALLQQRQLGSALLYSAASVVLGLVFVWAGFTLAKSV